MLVRWIPSFGVRGCAPVDAQFPVADAASAMAERRRMPPGLSKRPAAVFAGRVAASVGLLGTVVAIVVGNMPDSA